MSDTDKDEFCARFTRRLLQLTGPRADMDDIEDYAADIAPTYWENAEQRAEGPEECAEAEYSEWEPE